MQQLKMHGVNPLVKKKSKKQSPACTLLKKAQQPVYKPYKTFKSKDEEDPIYTTNNYDKYYGYSAPRKFSRRSNETNTYKFQLPDPYVSDEEFQENIIPAKIKNKSKKPFYQRHKIVEEEDFEEEHNIVQSIDSEDEYEDNYRINETTQEIESEEMNISYNIDSDEELDHYFNNDLTVEEEYNNIMSNIYSEEEDFIPQKTFKKKTKRIKPLKNIIVQEEEITVEEEIDGVMEQDNSYIFDLLLYIISGILLIFCLDQFIQIGEKIKPMY